MFTKKARVIAIYLPQFHPFKENDEWWGKGFTEWTNVGKAQKLFKNHYQPRVPADLGYYDLRCPWIREEQAALAKNAGIEGFMYWHYWFGNGRTLMSEIFNDVLSTGKPDFPFCLGWANHSWSRKTWNFDAKTHRNIDLIKQEYPIGDSEAHFYYVLPAFKDKRYITVDGKPLFLVFDPHDIPNCSEYLNTWRKLAQNNGLKGIHFVGIARGWQKTYQSVLDLGFDALMIDNFWLAQTEANHGYVFFMFLTKLRKFFPYLAPLNIIPYKKLIKHMFNEWDKKEDCYPQIMPNWDRSPRAGKKAEIIIDSNPELFKIHVNEALEMVKDKAPQHKIVFLKSWNEWGEGNYIEPDLEFGRGYLDALEDAIIEKDSK